MDTTVLIAALMVAISLILGYRSVIGNNRVTIRREEFDDDVDLDWLYHTQFLLCWCAFIVWVVVFIRAVTT